MTKLMATPPTSRLKSTRLCIEIAKIPARQPPMVYDCRALNSASRNTITNTPIKANPNKGPHSTIFCKTWFSAWVKVAGDDTVL